MTETNHIHQTHPEQAEMPFALVMGRAMIEPPKDLYIPPDALEVFLEAFEGPLDLLLYLIKRQNIDILDIPVAVITRQYMEYIALMEEIRLELVAEYLVMAAMLTEIKSRLLLPRPSGEEDEEDPRAELIRRLQQYEQFKKAAEDIDALPRVDREIYTVEASRPERVTSKPEPQVELRDILLSFQEVMARASMFSHHHIQMEPLSVRERMTHIMGRLDGDHFTEFTSLFTPEEGRRGVVVTLLAILELVRESLVELIEAEDVGSIYVKIPQNIHEPTTI